MRPWGLVIAVLVINSCSNAPETREAKRTATSGLTPAAPVVTEIDPVTAMEEASVALGEKLADIYAAARPQMTKIGGSVRYWSNAQGGLEIVAALAEDSAGFDDWEYNTDCSSAKPLPICALRVFAPNEVEAAAELLRRIVPDGTIDLRVVGKADKGWKAPKRPLTYTGDCGEAQCAIESGMLSLQPGMNIDSNEVLACLRALCTQALTGLGTSLVTPKLRGLVVIERGAASADRRAEVAIYAKLPMAQRRTVADTFLRKVGHR